MALRNLVEGECGAANPLVQWGSHFAQEKSLLKVGLNHDRLSDITQQGRVTEDQLVEEFLGAGQQHRPAVPQTYNMSTLLEELQGAQQATPPARLHPHAHQDDARVKEWVEEFAPPQATPIPPPTSTAGEWAQEFQQEHPPPSKTEEEWVREFAPSTDEKWVEEFESEIASKNKQLADVAKEMTETVSDPEIKETEFMNFIQKLATGEAEFDDKDEVVLKGGGWAGQFLGDQTESEGVNGGYWDRLEKEWQDMAKQEASHPWLSEFDATPTQYHFQEDNPLKETSQPLEEGLKRLREGDLPSAVLLFEAEVQARPDSVRGWQLLGSTQADNEQDQAAIPALHKCLELEPSNLAAHLSLAVCYTNESQQTKVQERPVFSLPSLQAHLHSVTSYPASQGKALDALRGWIQQNPKYSSLIRSEASAKATPPYTPSFMTPEQHAEVKDLYLAAAQMSPDSVDCDVQVGLGVLFNLSSEYDKAVDCFTAALQIRPDDAMLWNKLGATLANSSRSEEAVSAYRKALELMPGFTRSRYNLGVSCINLGAHKEAVEHFLTALHLQQHARGPAGAPPISPTHMSDGIWSTLRLALSLMGRSDLQPAVQSRDLTSLMKEFGVD